MIYHNESRSVIILISAGDRRAILILEVAMNHFLYALTLIFLLLTSCSLVLPAKTSIPPTLTPGIGSTLTGKDGMTLLYVPAGEFTMGSDADAYEQPAHTVYLDAFWIDQTEVTNAMYAKCVQDGPCSAPSSSKSSTRDRYYGNSQFDNYPVIYVHWFMASAYCKWREARLPTEAEWEKAARGENAFVYPWGNEFDGTRLNFCDKNCALDWANKSFDDGFADTSPVGNFPNGASPYGVLDMAGNVLEWVADWYSDTYYASSPTSNPLGPDSGVYRVARGGSWYTMDDFAFSTSRAKGYPETAEIGSGFRCALSATP
jgi:eukaryotic-like serine/threonine-protein kinase